MLNCIALMCFGTMMVMTCFSSGPAPLQNLGHQVNILDIFKGKVPPGVRVTYHGIKEL
jgi:hypothetical protein